MSRTRVRQLIQEALKERPVPTSLPENERVDFTVQQDAPSPKKSPEQELTDQHVANMQANRGLRDRYAKYAYHLALVCIVMWWLVILAQGAVNAIWRVEIWNSSVMIAITTGVTVNVLAAFLGVIRGLFGKDD